ELIISLGYSKSEAILYVSGLELGTTTVMKLAEKADIKRPTVYKLMEKLILSGLFNKVEKGWKVYFEASPPKHLYSLLESKKNKLNVLYPQLHNLFKNKNTSGIQYFQGIKEIKLLYLEILSEVRFSQPYKVIGNQQLFIKLDKPFFNNFINDRNNLNPQVKMILNDSEESHLALQYQRRSNVKIKLSQNLTTFNSNIIITPHKVIIHNLEEPTNAFVISQESIILSFSNLFDLLWVMLKR
ncbi:MAG: helix-turn-helix domain-containing protein, partial [Patescibacteria group bacterium]